MKSQSFNVDDIRRVREKMSARWAHMTHEQICDELSAASARADRIIAKIRRKKAKAAAKNAKRTPRTAVTPPS